MGSGSVLLFKAITPRRLTAKDILGPIEDECQSISKDILLDFELTVATWKTKVKFIREVTIGYTWIIISVITENEIYGWVDQGTPAHLISPRSRRGPKKAASMLAFMAGGTPKTIPGRLVSGYGSPGTDLVFASEVHHPGTEPRKFSEMIAKDWQKKIASRAQKAIDRSVKESGYGV